MSENITEVTPATQLELSRFVAENALEKKDPFVIAGGRTALHLRKNSSKSLLTLSTAELTEIIDYPARDMTITVEAGLRVEQLQQLLAEERQQLPVDISQANHATIGGAIATNCSGSRRFKYGTFRDYVIGVSAVDATGSRFSAGGRVVKNVAGYDLCKLLTGSWGTLAVTTQLTLKLKPIPERFQFLWISYSCWDDVEKGLQQILKTKTAPVVVDAINRQSALTIAAEARIDMITKQPLLVLGIEGTAKEVDWQIKQLQHEFSSTNHSELVILPPEESGRLLNAMTDFSIYADAPLTFYASLSPSKIIEFLQMCEEDKIAVMSHAGNGIVRGVFPDSIIIPTQAERILSSLRNFVLQSGGTFTILECENDWKDKLLLPITPEPKNWSQQLKHRLDPYKLLNPAHLF
ncbi:Glycolate dehydrogenase, FAD-binding subunit GlcE [hydrothermal vent metagenome]|uniref:Glycolate dehydrogenase, FAD-binding subunit GlcE n=1 Tax=hydrothermal vent metagenome TaxID=652676 RepID=A0A3B1DT60_9ZZZZ